MDIYGDALAAFGRNAPYALFPGLLIASGFLLARALGVASGVLAMAVSSPVLLSLIHI